MALMKAPLPPPLANDKTGAVIEMFPEVAITFAAPPAPPTREMLLLATMLTAVP